MADFTYMDTVSGEEIVLNRDCIEIGKAYKDKDVYRYTVWIRDSQKRYLSESGEHYVSRGYHTEEEAKRALHRCTFGGER